MRSFLVLLTFPVALQAQPSLNGLHADIDRQAVEIAPRVVEWRRDIHQHPELSFQETRTAALVAQHLRTLGLEVQTGVGGNGVVGHSAIAQAAADGYTFGLITVEITMKHWQGLSDLSPTS